MRRVVVTGLGALSPCGGDVAATWDAVVAGRSGISPIRSFDAAGWPVRIAGEVDGPALPPSVDPRLLKRLDRFALLGILACDEALVDAGFALGSALGDRAGVYLGTGIGGLAEMTQGAVTLVSEGHRAISPFFIPRALTNLGVGQVAMRWQARGPSLCVTTACATGNHSIGEAWRAIRLGDADLVVAGGAEAAVTPLGVAGFASMRALSRRNDEPARASRPFDRGRDGFVIAEGAGVVVLEALEHARARGARIYAEMVGYGLTNDAWHVTAPPPGHEGAARCMRMALRSAGLGPEDVDHVNAHATSTPTNDVEETHALKAVFGDHARRLTVSATKSVHGHLLGAAGGLEAVITALSLHEGVVPPTVNLDEPDPECDLDYVPGEARAVRARVALSNAFGFGGTNATIIFQRWEG